MGETDNATQRLFLALPLDDPTREGIQLFREDNRHLQQPGFRWVAAENLHITVFFLGAVRVAEQATLGAALAPVFSAGTPLRLHFEAFTVQPRRRPRMIWGRYHTDPAFTALANAAAGACAPFLLEPPRHFPEPIPHITVARLKKPPPEPVGRELPALAVSRVELWRSASGPRGVVYTALAGWNLGSENPRPMG